MDLIYELWDFKRRLEHERERERKEALLWQHIRPRRQEMQVLHLCGVIKVRECQRWQTLNSSIGFFCTSLANQPPATKITGSG